MPKNTPLPLQWITVDGQSVPLALPEHWDNDAKQWRTTGTENPLPVANYTQSENGVWLPTSESNPVPTQLTGSNVERIDVLEYDNSVPANTRIVVDDSVDTSNYKSLSIAVFTGKQIKYEVDITEKYGSRILSTGGTKILDSDYNYTSDLIDVRTSNARIRLTNKEDNAETFLMFVFLHKW